MARKTRAPCPKRGQAQDKQQNFAQAPFIKKQFPLRPSALLDEEAIEAIHTASLHILRNIGIECLLPEACAIFARHGCAVKDQLVTFDPDLLMETIATAPENFTIHARNPAHNLAIGSDAMVFCSVASAPNASDMRGGRRRGNFADFCDFLKLIQFFNVIDLTGGYPVEPVDIAPSIRHLDALSAMARMTDKVFHAYSLGADRNRDALEITRIVHQVSIEEFDDKPRLMSVINTNSPLRLDKPMMQGIIEMSRRNQVVVVTPFTLSGAMAPVTLVGALAQQNAEALAAIAFSQMVRPGAPVIYGGFTSNVDMKSGAPAFGTPEYMQACLVSGQLARRYHLPFRSSNVNAANCVDPQATWESVLSLWGAVQGGANMIMHAAGWLEGGLCASFEKFIIDVEILHALQSFCKPLQVDKQTLALDAIADVGHGGHFFGTPHTLARYRDAFHTPMIADWQNFENWQESGSQTAQERAHTLYRKVVDDLYELPAMEEGVQEALQDFVTRRKRTGGCQEL
ncbi:MAG: trimethylamine methyltransferase family protein [Pseudomonadota bacterium]